AMNIYRLIRLAVSTAIPAPFKLLGLLALHLSGHRTIGVFIDPVLACNLRCRMCYFSDPAHRAGMHGVIDGDYLDRLEKALFRRALKLQIGCGAEPTLYKDLEGLVKRGKRSGIPYISLTTNGQLIATGKVSLQSLVDAGLNEITISLHGTSKEIYEDLMPGASYDRFLDLVDILAGVKAVDPKFRIRVNYTVNSLNVTDLADDRFWKLWAAVQPDIVQLRPVQELGKTSWTDFDMTRLKELYATTIGSVVNQCRKRGIMCIAPTLDQLETVSTDQDAVSATIEDVTYCYVGPHSCYKKDFDVTADSYESYHRRVGTAGRLLRQAFSLNRGGRRRKVVKKLNYKVS
ncbi:MAG: radical SAM protein, partial [Muribaculaceae bacterium]|nr:radical SAM protein [Muribaculaceae bacterium]